MVVLRGIGLTEFYGLIGLGAGAIVIILWVARMVKAKDFEGRKTRIRATLFVGIPGLVMFAAGVYYRFYYERSGFKDDSSPYGYDSYDPVNVTPTMAEIYFVNKSGQDGRVQVGDRNEVIHFGEWEKISIKSDKSEDTLRAWLGDKLVIDTVIGQGSYIGNFSEDICAVAEQILYGSEAMLMGRDLQYQILCHAGIEQFSNDVDMSLYDFDEDPPRSKQVMSYQMYDLDWDLSLIEGGVAMEVLMEALMEAKSEEESPTEEKIRHLEEFRRTTGLDAQEE